MTEFSRDEFTKLMSTAILLPDLESDQVIYATDDKIIKVTSDPEEYENCLWINNHYRPYFIITHGIYEDEEGKRFIIMERARGKSLFDIVISYKRSIEKYEKKNPEMAERYKRALKNLYQQVLHTIADYNSLGFVHMDLHHKNIICENVTSIQEYNAYDERYVRSFSWSIKIIDYEYCFIKDRSYTTTRKIHLHAAFTGFSTIIMDPYMDYIKFYNGFGIDIPENIQLFLQDKHIFLGNDDDRFRIVYEEEPPKDEDMEEFYEVNGYPAVNDFLGPIEDTYSFVYEYGGDDNTRYLDEFFFFYHHLDPPEILLQWYDGESYERLKGDITRTVNSYRVKYLHELKEKYPEIYRVYLRRIGSYLTHIKKENVKNRDPQQLFKLLLNEKDTILNET